MSADTRVRDPEVVRLIAEVAADPRARIFQFDPSRRRDPALLRDVAVRPSLTGLTAAERELVSVQREEAALVLREAFCLRLERDASSALFVRHFELPDEVAWRKRARIAREQDGVPRSLHEEPIERWSAASLARASLQLVDTDAGRIYCAQDLIGRGQHQSAIRVLEGVLAGGPKPVHQWIAWQNIGHANSRLGRTVQARDAFATAAKYQGVGVEVLLNWLAAALGLGDAEGALDAANRLDQLALQRNNELSVFLEQIAALDPGSCETARRTVRGIRDRMGPLAGSVADAY